MKTQKNVWITGASSGIGAETALQMAAKGWHILVSARSEDKLIDLAKKSESMKGKITPAPCDVTDPEAITKTFETLEKDHGPIDMVLLNAGTYYPDTSEDFTAESFRKTFDINVNGVANCLEPVLKTFIKRKKGHIAIVASVAGFRGLPKSLSYGPTKAALINLAEALYMECKPHGVKVQVVNPGFVRTPLTDKNDFEMPMLMEVEDAAEVLIKGLESNQFEIVFPWLFVYLTKFVGLLPNKAYLWLVGKIKR
ncbi:MAG: SDR family NAD(P)-dependent oxidoreductase [Pseudomonadota bacterium]